jgi:transposase
VAKASKITDQQRRLMAKGLAEGKSQRVIAKEAGMSQPSVSKHIRRPEVRLLAVELREKNARELEDSYRAMALRIKRVMANPKAPAEEWLAAGRLLVDALRVDSQIATKLRVAETGVEATTAGHTMEELMVLYRRIRGRDGGSRDVGAVDPPR